MSREPMWRRYLRLAKPDAARDVDDELAFHLAMREAEYGAAGMDPAEARRMAHDRFGSVKDSRDACLAVDRRLERRERRSLFLEELAQDARYGVRTLWQHRGFSAAVIATLALGIGATTAMFSAVDAALLRPLPFRDAARLVVLNDVNVPFAPDGTAPTPEDTPDLRSIARMPEVFSAYGAYAMGGLNLTGDGDPERVNVGVVTAGLLGTLGARPQVGRAFSEEEGRIGGPAVALLSDGLWRRRFGGAPVLGRTIQLNGRSYQIIGVMPRGFAFPERSEMWIPLSVPLTFQSFEGFRGYLPTQTMARLAPGVSREQAASRLHDLWMRLPDRFRPSRDENAAHPLDSLQGTLVGSRDKALLLLLGTTALLLLIACANVTNLLLARAAIRRREIALRAVLGATRGRIVRQLVVESLILSLTGAAAGLVLAFGSLGTVRTLMPAAMVSVAPPAVDLRVLGFAMLLALLTGLLFGLWPAFGAARADAAETIKSGGLGATTGGAGRLRRLLVVGELGIALTLVSGSFLMLRSFKALLDTDPGFRPGQVGTVELSLDRSRNRGPRLALLTDVLARLDGTPGIAAAGVVNDLPLRANGGVSISVTPEDASANVPEGQNYARYLQASEGFFRALDIRLIAGRLMRPSDDSAAPHVVVINATMAARFWPGQDAVGKRFQEPTRGPSGPAAVNVTPYRTVIGVVADVRESGLEGEVLPQMYMPIYEQPPNNAAIVVRGTLPARALLERLRDAVHAARPDQAVFNLRMMDEVVGAARATRRTNTTLITAFGFLALLLAVVGVYGVVSYGVTRRTRELGIRAALGATRGDLMRLVAGEGVLLAVAGVALGVGGALAFARAMAGLLYGVGDRDLTSFVAAPLVLFVFVVAATLVPARRAARLNPVDVIRAD